MPQATAKNSWKSNPRLKVIEKGPKSISAGAKLKNLKISENSYFEAQGIVKSKIKRRASYDWEIMATKEEANDLKVETENSLKISAQCIRIVTDDRPKPKILFLRPQSSVFESNSYLHMNENPSGTRSHSYFIEPNKDNIYGQETKGNVPTLSASAKIDFGDDIFITSNRLTNDNLSKKSSITNKDGESVLTKFNPTMFNPRKVQSAKSTRNWWEKLSETNNSSNLTIDRRRGLYRPFTTGSYNKVAEKQARTKSELSAIINKQFPSNTSAGQRRAILSEYKEKTVILERKIKIFCDDIEDFKKQYYNECESYVTTSEQEFYDNNLEKLLRKLKVF